MDRFGIYDEGPKISIEQHLSKLNENTKDIFQEIRRFVLSLGSNVIEEVRPHRVVYAKSFNFRTFLDIQPLNDKLTVEVKMEHRGTPQSLVISSREQLEELKDMIQKAYQKI